MPDTLHPPYNITQPRILDRWLDVNSQNGPLKRCQTFVTIPTFNVASAWNGYSNIVVAFNYQAPNSFSFAQVSGFAAPLNLSFLLCVSYVNSNGSVVRYALNSNPNAVMFFDIIPYTNQMILKNFRIEVWSCNAVAVNNNPITLYTSVKQSVDYRYSNDSALVGVSNTGLNFDYPITLINGALYGPPIYFGSYGDIDYGGGPVPVVYTPFVGGLYNIQYHYYGGNSSYILSSAAPHNTSANPIVPPYFTGVAGAVYECVCTDTLYANTACTAYVQAIASFTLPLTFPNIININN